ncbi:MAG: hypothetical protein C4526_11580 [Nitrospiraceae bacterium]|nr:MAG: hypothetical protein C4526_11580 [Nitrospiraceae bacterium]
MRFFMEANKYILLPFIIFFALNGICGASGAETDGAAVSPSSVDIESRLKTAAGFISRGSYKAAEDILLDMERDETPEKQKVYFLLGRLYKEEGSYEEAENYLLKAADAYPLLREYALKLLVEAYTAAGKFESVVSVSRQIDNRLLTQFAKRSEINALLSLKREKDAVDALFQYIGDYPSDWDYKWDLAVLLKNSGETVRAARLMKEIYINAAPESDSALKELIQLRADTFTKDEILKRADSLYAKNNFQRAETEYRKALKFTGKADKDKVGFAVGMCQFRLKQYDRAARSFGVVKTPEALYYRGWAFHRMDNRRDFGKIKKEFRKRYPGNEKLALLLLMEADEFIRQRDFEDAAGNYKEVISNFPSRKEEALWGTGWMHYISGNYRAAQQYFSQLAAYEKSDNYYKYLYWKARARERAAGECLTQKLSARLSDKSVCDGEGGDFFSGLPSDRSFYGYLIRMRSSAPVLPMTVEASKPAKPEGETYSRIEALALSGMRDEAVNEIIESLRRNKNRNDFLYLGRIAMELGEYRKIIAFAEKEEDGEFLPYSFPFGFNNIIEEAAGPQDVDKYLVAAVIREESRFDPNAVSWAGAIGLMQLMPATAYRLKEDIKLRLEDRSEIHDVQKNILLGTHYLSKLLNEFREVPFALAAYNAGEEALKIWQEKYYRDDLIEFIENIPYKETRFYVKKVLRSYWQYRVMNGLPPDGPRMIAQGKAI